MGDFDQLLDAYQPDEYSDSGSENSTDDRNSDPTLKSLSESASTHFHSYPQDLTNDVNPGHFILFQAFKVDGIKIDDIVQGVKKTSEESIDQTFNPADFFTSLPNTTGDAFGNGEAQATDEAALSKIDDRNKLENRLNSQNTAIRFGDSVVDPGSREGIDILGKRKTLQDTIALYMPNNLSVSYGFDYAMDNTLMASGIRAVVDWMNNPNSGTSQRTAVRDLKNFAIDTGIKMGQGSMNLFGQDITGSISSLTRKVLNPHLEFLFKQVNQRSFSYTFSFFPKNKSEVDEVHEIIKKFKLHSHPIYDSKSTFLTMPSEFEILFYSSNKENKYLNRVLPCVLTGIEINYTPNGQASFFKDIDPDKSQAPVQIEMTLQFAETTLLHRDHIEKGF